MEYENYSRSNSIMQYFTEKIDIYCKEERFKAAIIQPSKESIA